MRAAFDRSAANENAAAGMSVAISLARMDPTPETRHMATMLTESGDVRVRQLALRALWKMSSPASTEVFAAFVGDEDYQSQLWAIYGLSRIGGATAQDGLLRGTHAADPRIRVEAIKVAEPDAALEQRLLELSDDPSRKVRRAASRRLGQLHRR